MPFFFMVDLIAGAKLVDYVPEKHVHQGCKAYVRHGAPELIYWEIMIQMLL